MQEDIPVKGIPGEAAETAVRDSDKPARVILEKQLSERLLRYGSHVVLLLLVGFGIWMMRQGVDTLPASAAAEPVRLSQQELDAEGGSAADQEMEIRLPEFQELQGAAEGVSRISQVHTILPSRQRFEVVQYTVQSGDTLFGIAYRFGLKPETLLWGNFETLQDDPHSLSPGMELNILPVDGTYYTWHAGDTLTGVAEFFGVEVEDIVDWPGNGLSPSIDPQDPGIEPGRGLVIPGGTREVVSWRLPRITRANPASARILGPGYCGQVVDGPIGTGTFVWPTPGQTISGYIYDPVVHPAIDIGGSTGNAIYASDTGVVVYAGWNNYGYGNVVVVDHGNGWQSLYAHMDTVGVVCGQAVFQGNLLGGMGSTGNSSGSHLHFEMMHDQYGKVNPLDFLP